MEKRKLIKEKSNNAQILDVFVAKTAKCLLTILILYVFMYQYVADSIPLLLPVLGIGIIGCGIYMCIQNFSLVRKSSYMGIFAIIIVVEVFSITVSKYGKISNAMGLNIFEFVLICYAVYIFLMIDRNHMTFILETICAAIVILAIISSIRGTVRSSGAIGIEGLNINLMSCMFLMGVYSIFMLLHRKTRFPKIFLYLCLVIIAVSQIQAASRRGFLVLCMFTILYFVYASYMVKNSEVSIETLVRGAVICILISAVLLTILYCILNYTALGQRLMGAFVSGDDKRSFFRELAWRIFLKYPVFGIGINHFAEINPYHMYSHSFYYELLVSTGVVGTALFLLYGIFLIRYILRTAHSKNKKYYKLSENELSQARTNLAFALCILLSGVAVVMWYDLYFYLWIAMITASCDSLRNKMNDYENRIYEETTTGLIKRWVRKNSEV